MYSTKTQLVEGGRSNSPWQPVLIQKAGVKMGGEEKRKDSSLEETETYITIGFRSNEPREREENNMSASSKQYGGEWVRAGMENSTVCVGGGV